MKGPCIEYLEDGAGWVKTAEIQVGGAIISKGGRRWKGRARTRERKNTLM